MIQRVCPSLEVNMRLGWLSDIHLNFLREEQLQAFLQELSATSVDAWLISGDIAEAPTLSPYLQLLRSSLDVPIYFVLGNHDFYKGSFSRVHAEIEGLTDERLLWLTSSGPVPLLRNLALVGDDGWADARIGDPGGSHVVLNDFYHIKELFNLSKTERIAICRHLGDESATRLRPKLEKAAQSARQVVVLIHVPPFRGATWHEGRISDNAWLPWFSCKAIGEVILNCAQRHPSCGFSVLCGHTHGGGLYQAAPNVMVHTAEAEYGVPQVQRVMEFE